MAVSSYVAPAPCLGICCQFRAKCVRYQAVQGMSGDVRAIGTCVTAGHERPLFTSSALAAALERIA